MFPFNFDDDELDKNSIDYQSNPTDNLNEYTFNNPQGGFPPRNAYDNDRSKGNSPDLDRRHGYDRRNGYNRDRRRDHDRNRDHGYDKDHRYDRDHGYDYHNGFDGESGNVPKSAPPKGIPSKNYAPGLRAVDPIAIRGCLYKYTYIWLTNRQQFWMYPTYVGRDSVAGYRWNGYRWTYTGFDLKLVESFSCVG